LTYTNDLYVRVGREFDVRYNPPTGKIPVLEFPVEQDNPDFTSSELQAMADDLNSFWDFEGVYIYYDSGSNRLYDLTFATFTIYHESFSINRELLEGRMNGRYYVEVKDARVIGFRHPTEDELIHFNWGIRGFTPSHWLPIITQEKVPAFRIQEGDYNMKLLNIPIGPRR